MRPHVFLVGNGVIIVASWQSRHYNSITDEIMCIVEHWNHKVGGVAHGEELIFVAKLGKHILVAILREEIILSARTLVGITFNIGGTDIHKSHGGCQTTARTYSSQFHSYRHIVGAILYTLIDCNAHNNIIEVIISRFGEILLKAECVGLGNIH